LPHIASEARHFDFLTYNRISRLERGDAFRRYRTDDAHSQPGAREGRSIHEIGGEPQGKPHGSHLVLEKEPQRLDKPEAHPLGQPAHVMVRLDPCGSLTGTLRTLDHIRIQRALRQKIDLPETRRFAIKNLDERVADDDPLTLRVRHATQGLEENFRGIHIMESFSQFLPKARYDLLRLVLAQQAGIHKDGG